MSAPCAPTVGQDRQRPKPLAVCRNRQKPVNFNNSPVESSAFANSVSVSWKAEGAGGAGTRPVLAWGVTAHSLRPRTRFAAVGEDGLHAPPTGRLESTFTVMPDVKGAPVRV